MDKKRIRQSDFWFLLTLSLIIISGLVMLSSAGNFQADKLFYVKKQLGWVILGMFIGMAVLRFDYGQIEGRGHVFYALSIVILLAVLMFGEQQRGTTGWIKIGLLPLIQPAEFTKVLLIIAFADFLNARQGQLETFSQILPCAMYMSVPFLLVALQPDLGTALVYIAITVVMLFVAGANPKILLGSIAILTVLIALALLLHFQWGMPLPLDDYQINRLTAFADPYADGKGGRGSGWNTIQSLTAIGSGGLLGKGLFEGTQVQLNFLPEHHTDFIFAVFGEELGFIGSTVIIILYGVLLYRAVIIAYKSRDFSGTLMVVGISAMWMFHIFENIGMCIGLMPITGIPLPFLSYGGSSMLSNFIAVGLLLSVNIRGKKLVF